MADERMAAGAEMDAEVARRVFGHTVWETENDIPPVDISGIWPADADQVLPQYVDRTVTPPIARTVPRYSTDLASAWLVVDQLREQGWLVRVQEMPEGYPYLDNDTGTPLFYSKAYVILHWAPEVRDGRLVMAISAKGLTSSEAICRAALAAAGAGEEG